MSSWHRVEAKAGPGQRVQAGSSAEPAYQWHVPQRHRSPGAPASLILIQ